MERWTESVHSDNFTTCFTRNKSDPDDMMVPQRKTTPHLFKILDNKPHGILPYLSTSKIGNYDNRLLQSTPNLLFTH